MFKDVELPLSKINSRVSVFYNLVWHRKLISSLVVSIFSHGISYIIQITDNLTSCFNPSISKLCVTLKLVENIELLLKWKASTIWIYCHSLVYICSSHVTLEIIISYNEQTKKHQQFVLVYVLFEWEMNIVFVSVSMNTYNTSLFLFACFLACLC